MSRLMTWTVSRPRVIYLRTTQLLSIHNLFRYDWDSHLICKVSSKSRHALSLRLLSIPLLYLEIVNLSIYRVFFYESHPFRVPFFSTSPTPSVYPFPVYVLSLTVPSSIIPLDQLVSLVNLDHVDHQWTRPSLQELDPVTEPLPLRKS